MPRHNAIRFEPIASAPRDGTLIIARNTKDRGYPYSYKARWVDGQWYRLGVAGAVVAVTVEPLEWRPAPKLAAVPARPHSIG